MEIKLSGKDDVAVSDELKKKIEHKFMPKIEKLLTKFPEDVKVGYISFLKPNHFTYKVNFDMQLPHKHIYADAQAENWSQAIVSLRRKVEQEIKSSKGHLTPKNFKSMSEVTAENQVNDEDSLYG